MRLTAAPTLAEVAAHPELVDQLSGSLAGVLAVEATGLVQQLMLRAVVAPPRLADDREDELLDTRTAARRLGMSPTTLAHRAHQGPWRDLRIENGTRSLRWSRRRIDAFLVQGARAPVAPSASLEMPGPRGMRPVPPPRRQGTTGRPAPSSLDRRERGGEPPP